MSVEFVKSSSSVKTRVAMAIALGRVCPLHIANQNGHNLRSA